MLSDKWSWKYPNEDQAEGPFSSKELALDDARKCLQHDAPRTTGKIIEVGWAIFPSPACFWNPNVDDILEQMEGEADIGGFYRNGEEIFELDCPAKNISYPQQELNEILDRWKRKWIKASSWTFLKESVIDLSLEE